MSPITKFGLLSLASTAMAAPWSLPSGYLTGSGYPTGSGKPYPAGNGTGIYGNGTGTAASTGFVASTGFRTVTNIVTVSAAGVSTSSSCSTPTVSTTTTHVLTQTIIPFSSTTAAAVAASSSVEAAGFSYGGHSYSWGQYSWSTYTTSSSAPAPAPTTSSTSSTPVAPVETSTTSTSSTSVAPVETSTTPTSTAAPTTSSAPAVETTTSSVAPVETTTSSSTTPVETTTSTSSAATATSSYSSGSSSSSKRGLPYNSASLTTCFAGSKVSWAYNWASTSDGLDTSDFEYVPMLWGNTDTYTSTWLASAKSAIASGSTHLLAFNEPDLSTQSNIDAATAAASYKTWISDAFGGTGVQLGSPAVTNGGGSMGLSWLASFFDACTDCQVDFVAIHWYDSYSNFAYFQQHVTQAHTQTGKPVWITEFGTTDGDDEQIAGFLEQALPWLDSQDFVQRYAYFMAADGLLNEGTGMSSYGETYATYE